MSTLVASSSKGAIIQCHSQPELPNGLILADNCDISGTPTILLEQSNFLIISNNSGGVHQRNLSITIFDQPPANIFYGSGDYTFAKQVDQITLTPTYQGGEPLVWSISPSLPNRPSPEGIFFSIKPASRFRPDQTWPSPSFPTVRLILGGWIPLPWKRCWTEGKFTWHPLRVAKSETNIFTIFPPILRVSCLTY